MQNNIKTLQLTPAAMHKPVNGVSLPSSEPSTITADSQIAQIFGGAFITALIHGQVKNTNNVRERAAPTQGGFINLLHDNRGT